MGLSEGIGQKSRCKALKDMRQVGMESKKNHLEIKKAKKYGVMSLDKADLQLMLKKTIIFQLVLPVGY